MAGLGWAIACTYLALWGDIIPDGPYQKLLQVGLIALGFLLAGVSVIVTELMTIRQIAERQRERVR